MLFYWWRKEVRKKRTTSKHYDSKTSPQVPLHPPKLLSLEKIPAPIFENKNSTSNYPKFIPSIMSSSTSAISKAPVITNKPFSISLAPSSIAKILWTENHVKSQQSPQNSKDKDPFSKSNKLKKDPFWKVF